MSSSVLQNLSWTQSTARLAYNCFVVDHFLMSYRLIVLTRYISRILHGLISKRRLVSKPPVMKLQIGSRRMSHRVVSDLLYPGMNSRHPDSFIKLHRPISSPIYSTLLLRWAITAICELSRLLKTLGSMLKICSGSWIWSMGMGLGWE